MVAMVDGRPVLLALQTASVDDADVLNADPSFDVWSFGAAMYELVARRPLFAYDARENLDARGLEALARWDEFALKKRLRLVDDPNARDLLTRMLQPDPEDRPTMQFVLNHAMLNVEKLASQQLDKFTAVVQAQEVVVVDAVAAMHADVRTGFASMNEQLSEVASAVQQMNTTLVTNQKSVFTMLKSLLTGDHGCPRYVCMLPKAEAKGFFGKLFELSKPKNWVSKTVTIHFVCAVTLKPGEPYELVLPKDWVTKYGPALRLGLSVLKVACGVGRLMGLPIPTASDARNLLSDVKGKAADAISEQTDFLNSMHESITESMNEQEELQGVAAWMDEKLADTAAEWTEVPETQEMDGLPAASSSGSPHEIVQKSFQEMRDLGASLEEPDPDFARSGLVFAVGPDGTSEMVAPEVKVRKTLSWPRSWANFILF
jgi:hypothetical protein